MREKRNGPWIVREADGLLWLALVPACRIVMNAQRAKTALGMNKQEATSQEMVVEFKSGTVKTI
ncbi:hypothetical protein [Sulfurirhabdus autotrophica]|uniref:hypothetical protein n=1 Tax=Sulfurirhabdus autotrophica TaxID=1706046 RepID=UPI001CB8F0E2|nr:hypothetical protein [Sulfurirhabdus autotrophica]